MYTLIEFFDSKQYENIITPLSLSDVSKVIYVGTKEIMTDAKMRNLKFFYSLQESSASIEFHQIERDNPESFRKVLTLITQANKNCVFDATGGEDFLLTSLGLFAGKLFLPIIRTNTNTGEICEITELGYELEFSKPSISLDALIALEGGRIVNSINLDTLSADDENTIYRLFAINSINCEKYISFCNLVSEYVSDDHSTLFIPESELTKLRNSQRELLSETFDRLIEKNLITSESVSSGMRYRINRPITAICLKKAGNVLEYYTAITAGKSGFTLTDVRIGASIEWNGVSDFAETHNEIDVLAVYNNKPVFISCKNGEVKKEALYELDTVSRALGGSYAKKILVCSHLSKNRAAREHILRRARDMKIGIIFNTHRLSSDSFAAYLKKQL